MRILARALAAAGAAAAARSAHGLTAKSDPVIPPSTSGEPVEDFCGWDTTELITDILVDPGHDVGDAMVRPHLDFKWELAERFNIEASDIRIINVDIVNKDDPNFRIRYRITWNFKHGGISQKQAKKTFVFSQFVAMLPPPVAPWESGVTPDPDRERKTIFIMENNHDAKAFLEESFAVQILLKSLLGGESDDYQILDFEERETIDSGKRIKYVLTWRSTVAIRKYNFTEGTDMYRINQFLHSGLLAQWARSQGRQAKFGDRVEIRTICQED